MPATASSSASPAADTQLLSVPFAELHAHPVNANHMSAGDRGKLKRNIARVGRYEPIVATLLAELSTLASPEALAQTLALGNLDADTLLADLTAATKQAATTRPRLVSFSLDPDDEAVVEQAIAAAMDGLTDSNRRGRALARLCARFLGAAVYG